MPAKGQNQIKCKKHVQTEFGRTQKRIRSDRSGENTGEELQKFLKNEGIQVELTTPYTPEQNGCTERKYLYLIEITRSMLIDSGLPNKYWGEGLITTIHLQNRLPAVVSESTKLQIQMNLPNSLQTTRETPGWSM